MTEKAPVEKGGRFVSMRTGKEAVVESMSHGSGVYGRWAALVKIDGTVLTWLTCSKDGIRGYRRKA